MITIYTLSYKSNDTPFYVGATKLPLNRRFGSHGNLLKENRINKKDVYISSIDTCNPIDAQKMEVFWISQLMFYGFSLINKMTTHSTYSIPRIKKENKSEINFKLKIEKLHNMIAGQENDGVALKLKELLPEVMQQHREQLCKRNKFGKHEICSPSTLYTYMDKGEVKNAVLGRHIYNALKKIVDNN